MFASTHYDLAKKKNKKQLVIQSLHPVPMNFASGAESSKILMLSSLLLKLILSHSYTSI